MICDCGDSAIAVTVHLTPLAPGPWLRTAFGWLEDAARSQTARPERAMKIECTVTVTHVFRTFLALAVSDGRGSGSGIFRPRPTGSRLFGTSITNRML